MVWSVTIPTLVGAAMGAWFDNQHVGSHTWTVSFILLGLLVGTINARRWVTREEMAMREEFEAESED